MVNISALMKALPVSSLEPQRLASLYGFMAAPKGQEWRHSVQLLEPPAGQHVPYINPLQALVTLLCGQGVEPQAAQLRAREAMARMKHDLAPVHWVNFLEYFQPESPDCRRCPTSSSGCATSHCCRPISPTSSSRRLRWLAVPDRPVARWADVWVGSTGGLLRNPVEALEALGQIDG